MAKTKSFSVGNKEDMDKFIKLQEHGTFIDTVQVFKEDSLEYKTLPVRMSIELHQAAKLFAAQKGITLHELLVRGLISYIGYEG